MAAAGRLVGLRPHDGLHWWHWAQEGLPGRRFLLPSPSCIRPLAPDPCWLFFVLLVLVCRVGYHRGCSAMLRPSLCHTSHTCRPAIWIFGKPFTITLAMTPALRILTGATGITLTEGIHQQGWQEAWGVWYHHGEGRTMGCVMDPFSWNILWWIVEATPRPLPTTTTTAQPMTAIAGPSTAPRPSG